MRTLTLDEKISLKGIFTFKGIYGVVDLDMQKAILLWKKCSIKSISTWHLHRSHRSIKSQNRILLRKQAVINGFKQKGYVEEHKFYGEYLLLVNPQDFTKVRIYDNGQIWKTSPRTGEYELVKPNGEKCIAKYRGFQK